MVCKWVEPTKVAGPLYDVTKDATGYLIGKAPDSQQFQEIRRAVEEIAKHTAIAD